LAKEWKGRDKEDEKEGTRKERREKEDGKIPILCLPDDHLAWRLTIDGHDDGLDLACHLLSELQRPAEDTFGRTHMQTIAILTT
jgi:hypothetical protein